MNRIQKFFSMFVITIMLAACGGGGGGGDSSSGDSGGSGGNGGNGGNGGSSGGPGTATIAFSVASTAPLPASVQGVSLVAFLPAGTSVATNTGSNTISSTALTAGSGITSTNRQVFGTYSAAANKVKIIVVTTEETFKSGEFAKLTVGLPSSATLSASDFSAANQPSFPFFQSAGFDAATDTSFDLTSKLQASMGVTFN